MKLSQYERLAAQSSFPESEGVRLSSGFTFSSVSERHERHNIAVAKIQYYRVVSTAGELLLFSGLALLVIGYVRLRGRISSPENKTLLDRA